MNSVLKSLDKQTSGLHSNMNSVNEKTETDTDSAADYANPLVMGDMRPENKNSDFLRELSKVKVDFNLRHSGGATPNAGFAEIELVAFPKKWSISPESTTPTNQQTGLIDLENHTQTHSGPSNKSQLLPTNGISPESQKLGPNIPLQFEDGRSKNLTQTNSVPSSPAQATILHFEASTSKHPTEIEIVSDSPNLFPSVSSGSDILAPQTENKKGALNTYIREAPSTLSTDYNSKITPEGQINLGASSQANSIATVKTVPTPVLMSQSSMHHPPAVQTVAQNLAMVQETQSGITVRLNPPEMGRVFIDFQFNGDRSLTAVIRSEVPETAIALKQNADFLQDTLKDSGFNSVTLSFEQNDGSKRDGSDFDRNQNTPIFYQSIPNHDGVEIDTMESIPRQLLTSNSAIDLKL